MDKEDNSITLTRRDFIKTTAMATLAFNVVGCSTRQEKPNLLFIWTDQQRPDTMKIYGNPQIHVPNLNKFSEQCVVFDNTYAVQPVCAPSRGTVMTGLYPHTHGVVENNLTLPQNIPCLPEIIDDKDYRTGYYGKWHLGNEFWPQHGFEEWVSIEDIYNEYFTKGHDKNRVSDYAQYLLSLGYKPDEKRGAFTRQFESTLPIEHSKPKFLEGKTIDFLRRHRKDPFILYVNFLEPHPPFNGPFNDMYDPDRIKLPPNFDDPLGDDEPLRYRLLRNRFYEEKYKGDDLKTPDDWRKEKAKYWGLVSEVDLSVGAILNELDKLGLSDNTIVAYTSDHGEMLGAHRLLNKKVMYEEAEKVPFLMRLPNYNYKPRLIGGRTSNIDIVPTLLNAMGYEADLQGQSLMPVIRNRGKNNRDIFIEWTHQTLSKETFPPMPGVSQADVDRVEKANVRSVVTQEGWKLNWSDLDKSQLYDLNKDPYETTNLYYKKGQEYLIANLKKKILDWQEKTNDSLKIENS